MVALDYRLGEQGDSLLIQKWEEIERNTSEAYRVKKIVDGGGEEKSLDYYKGYKSAIERAMKAFLHTSDIESFAAISLTLAYATYQIHKLNK